MTGHDRGRRGEDIAAAYLRKKGYRILSRNFRTRRGEVDIVCGTGNRTVFVEVKTWTTMGADQLGRAIDREKQRRIVAAARQFLLFHPESAGSVSPRFDVVFVQSRCTVLHVQGAFDSEWPE